MRRRKNILQQLKIKKIVVLIKVLMLVLMLLSISIGFTMNLYLKSSLTYRRNYVDGVPSVYSYGEYLIGRYLAERFRGEKRILVISDGATAAVISAIGLVEGWTPGREDPVVKQLWEVLSNIIKQPINASKMLGIINMSVNLRDYDLIFFVCSTRTYFYIKYGVFHLSPALMPNNITEYETIIEHLNQSHGFRAILRYNFSVLYKIEINHFS
ncbi:MAG: hypothetical protein ACTSUJ_09175 [Candidatus Njordarchaeales archaeon]